MPNPPEALTLNETPLRELLHQSSGEFFERIRGEVSRYINLILEVQEPDAARDVVVVLRKRIGLLLCGIVIGKPVDDFTLRTAAEEMKTPGGFEEYIVGAEFTPSPLARLYWEFVRLEKLISSENFEEIKVLVAKFKIDFALKGPQQDIIEASPPHSPAPAAIIAKDRVSVDSDSAGVDRSNDRLKADLKEIEIAKVSRTEAIAKLKELFVKYRGSINAENLTRIFQLLALKCPQGSVENTEGKLLLYIAS